MSLADQLAQDTTLTSGTRCSVCRWYESLPDGDRAVFDQWVADGKPVLRLWRACQKQGLTVGNCQFYTHVKDHHRVAG